MNPTDIADALDILAKALFDAADFGYAFADATDNAKATIAKMRAGATNKSDLPHGVLLNDKFHYAPATSARSGCIARRCCRCGAGLAGNGSSARG